MPLERIFANFKEGSPADGGYDPADPPTYESFVQAMIRDSRDYEGSVLAPARDTAQKYYYGYLPALNPDGSPFTDTQIVQDPNATYEQILGYDQEGANRSTYVSTDVRDAVMLTMPSLIRLFASSENVVNLVPRSQADVDVAQQQTSYINYCFWQDNPGFLILHGAFKDALTVRTGFVKWWTDDHKETKRKTFINLSSQQIQMLLQQDNTAKVERQGNFDEQNGTFDEVTFTYVVDKPLIKVAGVPPEEMRLDRYARSFSTSRIVGHERVAPIEDLTRMGYTREFCMEFLQSQEINNFTMESQLRNPGRYMSTRVGDGVLYGEWYIRIDRDGDGVAELRYICTMGEDHTIVHDVEANRVKFAHFGVDPISHTIVGDSLADYVQDIQRFKTNMMRGCLDNLAESINPKTAINELVTDVDDAQNDDVGAIIRVRGDPRAAVSFMTVPFAGQQILPILEQMNETLQRRTGLSDAAKGLDPKQLQSSTEIGVQAIINGQQERTELIARVLAETGFRDLFEGLYNEISEAPNQRRTIRIRGKWTDIDTGTFDASMGVEVNSTLGKGSDSLRLAALSTIKSTQEQIMQQFGVTNPVVGIQQYLNTITDMLELSNIKNVGRYFMTPPPQVLQAIAGQPKEPDAMTIAARAQFEKVKSETAQALSEQQLRAEKQRQDDAYRHAALQEKSKYDQQKIDIDRAKLGVSQPHEGAPGPDPAIEGGKIAADLHKAHLDAKVTANTQAMQMMMQERDRQMKMALEMAKLEHARQQAELQASTALSTAAMRPPPGGGVLSGGGGEK
jgi:hypothetical protein